MFEVYLFISTSGGNILNLDDRNSINSSIDHIALGSFTYQ